jgi:hypothetical protein
VTTEYTPTLLAVSTCAGTEYVRQPIRVTPAVLVTCTTLIALVATTAPGMEKYVCVGLPASPFLSHSSERVLFVRSSSLKVFRFGTRSLHTGRAALSHYYQ